MIRRQIICDVCGKMRTELVPGDGFPGWGSLQGIQLDGVDNPSLCPEHLRLLADFLDTIKQQHEEEN